MFLDLLPSFWSNLYVFHEKLRISNQSKNYFFFRKNVFCVFFKLFSSNFLVNRKLCILGQKSKREFFKTYILQAFFKMLTHRETDFSSKKKGLYEACSIPHSELSKLL